MPRPEIVKRKIDLKGQSIDSLRLMVGSYFSFGGDAFYKLDLKQIALPKKGKVDEDEKYGVPHEELILVRQRGAGGSSDVIPQEVALTRDGKIQFYTYLYLVNLIETPQAKPEKKQASHSIKKLISDFIRDKESFSIAKVRYTDKDGNPGSFQVAELRFAETERVGTEGQKENQIIFNGEIILDLYDYSKYAFDVAKADDEVKLKPHLLSLKFRYEIVKKQVEITLQTEPIKGLTFDPATIVIESVQKQVLQKVEVKSKKKVSEVAERLVKNRQKKIINEIAKRLVENGAGLIESAITVRRIGMILTEYLGKNDHNAQVSDLPDSEQLLGPLLSSAIGLKPNGSFIESYNKAFSNVTRRLSPRLEDKVAA